MISVAVYLRCFQTWRWFVFCCFI